jgi:electron transfer flavoprotein alpha subunit
MERHVVVVGEIGEAKVSTVTKEVLGAARILADKLGEEVIAMFLGSDITNAVREAFSFGADKVLVADCPDLKEYRTDAYLYALTRMTDNPRIILLGNTAQGADLGIRLAFRLKAAIVTDCVDLSLNEGRLVRTKPVYGGAAMANYCSEGFPQMATIRPKSFAALDKKNGASKEISQVPFTDIPSVTTFVERVTEDTEEGVKLEDAEVIVSGGRGVGGPEGFEDLKEMAKLLKGAVGASRVAVDNNWVPSTIQVGITGKIVAPSLYLAVGISGASQHMTGCSRSKTIIAVNKDSGAPIFKYAHYGLVGDWKTVIPVMIEKLRSISQ